MLKKILIGVVGVVIVFVAVVATRPAAYHVERTVEVAAPAEVVFGVVNDLHSFTDALIVFGKPWIEADPGMQKTFEGQSVSWSGNMDVGQGKLTIVESVPGEKVAIRLDFEKPMKSTASLRLALTPASSGTAVTWAMDGTHNFLGKAFGLFMDMDGMLGRDIEASLARVKTAAEAKQAQASN